MIKLGRLAFLKNDNVGPKKLVIKIPSETKHIKKVSEKVIGSVSSYGPDEGTVFDIKLCIEEAVRNAIVHGNHSEKNKAVVVTTWVDAGKVFIAVEDEGEGYDHTAVPDPTAEHNMLRNSGRGVYLIKKLMDEVTFNARGNGITMGKKLK